MLDERQKHTTYGQAINIAADFVDANAFQADSGEYIATVLLTADTFYAEMIKRQAALVTLPKAAEVAQRAAAAAAAAVAMDPFEVPFGEEPPPVIPPPLASIDDQALPEMQTTGLGMHRPEKWAATTTRCPACGLATLVQNRDEAAKLKFECSTRHRQKSPSTGEYATVSACDYTAWRND